MLRMNYKVAFKKNLYTLVLIQYMHKLPPRIEKYILIKKW